MKKTIHVNSPAAKEQALILVAGLDPDHDVIIEPHREDRTKPQNGQYFVWVGILANEYGYTKHQTHLDLKERHLVPIFARDNDRYADMIELLREEWQRGNRERAERLRRELIGMTSITRTSKRQMREYMTEVDREAASNGIILPRREDCE